MPFSTFQQLVSEAKRLKLISAFEKIDTKFQKSKWIFKCCRNIIMIEEIYLNFLEMDFNTRGFVKGLMEDSEDIEEKPACFHHNPSVNALDYLVTDFQMLIDLIIQSLKSKVIYNHAKFDVLFELAHSVYQLLNLFRRRYISRISNES